MNIDFLEDLVKDPRARRSVRSIIKAVEKLIDSGIGVDDLNITQITREAHVTRPTFYQYFSSVSDAIRATTADRLNEIFQAAPIADSDNPWPGYEKFVIRPIIEALIPHEKFAASVISGSNSIKTLELLIDGVADRLNSVPAIQAAIDNHKDLPNSYYVKMVAAGLVWRIKEWLTVDAHTSRDEIAAELADVLNRAFSGN